MSANTINVWYVYKRHLPTIQYYTVKIEQPRVSISGPITEYVYLIRKTIFEKLSLATDNLSYAILRSQVSTELSSRFTFTDNEFKEAILKLYFDNVVFVSGGAIINNNVPDAYNEFSYTISSVNSLLTNSDTRYSLNPIIVSYEDDYLGNFDTSTGELGFRQTSDIGTVREIYSYDETLGNRTSLSTLYVGEGQTSSNDDSQIFSSKYTRVEQTITVVSPTALPGGLVGNSVYIEFTNEVVSTGLPYPYSASPGLYTVLTQSVDLKTITVKDGNISVGDTSQNIPTPLVATVRFNYSDVTYIRFTRDLQMEVRKYLPVKNPTWNELITPEQFNLNPVTLPVTLPPSPIPTVPNSNPRFTVYAGNGNPVMEYVGPILERPETHRVIKVYGSETRALAEGRVLINTNIINGVQIEYPNGTYTRYHPNGYISQTYTYERIDNFSFLSGPFAEYYSNGELKCQGNIEITNRNVSCTYSTTIDSILITGLTDHLIRARDCVRLVVDGTIFAGVLVRDVPNTSSINLELPPNFPTTSPTGTATITAYDSVMNGQFFEYYSSGANRTRCNIVRGRIQGDVYQWDEEGNREYVVLGMRDGTFDENTVVLNYTFTY